MKQLLLPKKIVKFENVINPNALKVKKPLQVVHRRDEEWKNSNAVVDGTGYIILDFGKEMNGSIRIITGASFDNRYPNGKEPALRIRFGESLTETCSDIDEKGATNDHSPRDFTANISSYGDVRFGNSGFRFVRIDFLKNLNIIIQNIFCENEILVKKPVYRYNGTDKRVKQIFDTAKRTVDLCAAGEYIWDGIKRDRLVWIGDMHPEMLALSTMYGKLDKVERSLEFVRDQTPLPLWMNGISSYSMWWMIIVADYYLITGAKDFAVRQIEYFKGLINRFDELVDESGKMDYGWNFVDWPSCDSGDEESGVRAINIMAVQKAIEMFKDFNEDTSLAKSVLSKLKKVPITVNKMKQVIGLKYMAEGAISDDDYDKLILGGAKGMSTFMSYYILKAIASKNPRKAIEIMKEYYGAMLDLGATTFFEDFNIDWTENCSRIDKFPKKGQKDIHGDFGAHCYVGFRHSLCHGWSSGVIKFIKEYENLI